MWAGVQTAKISKSIGEWHPDEVFVFFFSDGDREMLSGVMHTYRTVGAEVRWLEVDRAVERNCSGFRAHRRGSKGDRTAVSG